jgi:RecA/RadA recombinase
MAKSKKPETAKTDIRAMFKTYASNNKGSTIQMFDEAELPNIDSFISTGCYSLNKILSGSLFKGIAHRRLTGIVGLPGVGKTYVCKNVIREAQKEGYAVIIYDTENAYSNQDLIRSGIDPSLVARPDNILTINQWKTSIQNELTGLHTQNPDQKFLVVTDSLANLLTEKEITDTEEGGTAADMGLRAKQYAAASRILQKTIANCNATMLITNHSYEKVAQNPKVPPVEVPKGGNGFIYMVSYMLGIKKYNIKTEVKNEIDNSTDKVKIGNRMVFTTLKNRFVPEGMTSEAFIHFKEGLLPYQGLLEDAVRHGFIEKAASRWHIKHLDKTVWAKDLYTDEIWQPILPDLDKKMTEELQYSSYGGNSTSSENIPSVADEGEVESKDD